ncbi:MAG TPA: hypothetical protein VFV52_15005 [Bacilli bacterium]|nr:hypothetical protein [Bacilli bacterium]
MRRLWTSERGSALLLVMYAVVISGLLFGSLWLVVQQEQTQSVWHQQAVQAEFEAQKLMEIALYYYYNEPEEFERQFAAEDPCETYGSTAGQVCLQTDAAADGSRVLTANGWGAQAVPDGEQAGRITVDLDQLDAADSTVE